MAIERMVQAHKVEAHKAKGYIITDAMGDPLHGNVMMAKPGVPEAEAVGAELVGAAKKAFEAAQLAAKQAGEALAMAEAEAAAMIKAARESDAKIFGVKAPPPVKKEK